VTHDLLPPAFASAEFVRAPGWFRWALGHTNRTVPRSTKSVDRHRLAKREADDFSAVAAAFRSGRVSYEPRPATGKGPTVDNYSRWLSPAAQIHPSLNTPAGSPVNYKPRRYTTTRLTCSSPPVSTGAAAIPSPLERRPTISYGRGRRVLLLRPLAQHELPETVCPGACRPFRLSCRSQVDRAALAAVTSISTITYLLPPTGRHRGCASVSLAQEARKRPVAATPTRRRVARISISADQVHIRGPQRSA